VYCGDRPLERRRTTAITSPLLFSWAKPSAFEINSPGTQLTLGHAADPVAGQPRADRRAGRQPLRQGSGLPAAFLMGILRILERQLRDASGEAIRQKLEKVTWICGCACGEPAIGLRLRPRPLPSRCGPYGITDLTTSSVADTLERIEGPDGCGVLAEGLQLPCSTARQDPDRRSGAARDPHCGFEVPAGCGARLPPASDRPAMTPLRWRGPSAFAGHPDRRGSPGVLYRAR